MSICTVQFSAQESSGGTSDTAGFLNELVPSALTKQ